MKDNTYLIDDPDTRNEAYLLLYEISKYNKTFYNEILNELDEIYNNYNVY